MPGRGNTPTDREWIEAQAEAGLLKPIDDTLQLPFRARMVWDGDISSLGSLWVIPTEDKRCKGREYVRDETGAVVVDPEGNRIERPCTVWAIEGTDICLPHAGGTRARAKRLAMEAAQERASAWLDAALGNLQQLALKARSEKVRYDAIVKMIELAGMKAAAQDINVNVPTHEKLLEKWNSMGFEE